MLWQHCFETFMPIKPFWIWFWHLILSWLSQLHVFLSLHKLIKSVCVEYCVRTCKITNIFVVFLCIELDWTVQTRSIVKCEGRCLLQQSDEESSVLQPTLLILVWTHSASSAGLFPSSSKLPIEKLTSLIHTVYNIVLYNVVLVTEQQ